MKPLVMSSVEAARSWTGAPIGLLFVDGWHSEKAVYEDGCLWSPHLSADATVEFDDWRTPELYAGIRRLLEESRIPPPVGSVGKDLVCTWRALGGRVSRILIPDVLPQ